MKKILVTTDLSEESQAAFRPARELALSFGGSVELIAVIEDPAQAALMYALDFPVLPGPDVQDQLKKKVQDDLEGYIAQSFQGIPTASHVIVADGSVHGSINRFAKEHDFNLIVIATHGKAGLTRLLIGSVAEKVVRESTCPVLTIPSPRT